MYATGFSTENCCHSWRRESKMALVMDVFYDPNDKKAQVSLNLEHSLSGVFGYMHRIRLLRNLPKSGLKKMIKFSVGLQRQQSFPSLTEGGCGPPTARCLTRSRAQSWTLSGTNILTPGGDRFT